jgi:arsenic resistance protein ArsH
MFTIANQSSLPMAYKAFEDEGGDGSGKARLLPSGNRERLVDCMEEFVKFSIIMRPHLELFGSRFSERREKEERLAERAAGEDARDIIDKI